MSRLVDPTQPTLAGVVAAIGPLTDRFARAIPAQPRSLAERDGRRRIGRHALELGATGISAAVEHLDAWRILYEVAHVLPSFAHITLIRTAVEGSVKARWLLDTAITSDERLARGVSAQRADYEERRKFEEAAGMVAPRTGSFKPAKERISELEKAARSVGIPVRKPPDRIRLFDQYVFPAVESQTPRKVGGVLYRLISGPAHAMQWSLMTGSVDVEFVEEASDHLTRLGRITGNEQTALTATLVGVLITLDALKDLESYTRSPASPAAPEAR